MRPDHGPAPDPAEDAPPVAVRRRRLPSAIWAIPIVAALIGAYLVWVDYSTRGPTITITFDDATGLVAGKTIVKYKDVEIGKVATVALSDGLSKINVTAAMRPEFAPFLTDGARFWLVSAEVSASGISGLETLLSGSYVGADPGPIDGRRQRVFSALPEPPLIRADVPGTEFILHADQLGGIGRGSIITFQGFTAGRILGAELSDDRRSTVFRAFVQSPYDELVTPTSRFWNASGFSVDVSATGVTVNIDSLPTVLAGGIGFDAGAGGSRAEAGARFRLFPNRQAAEDAAFTARVEMIAVFADSVRGLRPGAEVSLRGLRIGRVKDVGLVFDPAQRSFTVPVRLEVEPERFRMADDAAQRTPEQGMDRLRALVASGLRAQLQTASLITGELLVAFDFFPDAPVAALGDQDGVPVVPTVPTQLETLSASLTAILNKVAGLPLEGLVSDLRTTVQHVDALVASPEIKTSLAAVEGSAQAIRRLSDDLAAATPAVVAGLSQNLGQLEATLRSARAVLGTADGTLAPDSPLRTDLTRLLRELQSAARSIRVFAEYLERHPEALLRGKGVPTR